MTHRTDLFALGVIAYRVLTGRPAFEGEATAEILYKVVHSMPPQPTTLAALPAAMDLVLAVALAKNPADRFDSGAELAAAMDPQRRAGRRGAPRTRRAPARETPAGRPGLGDRATFRDAVSIGPGAILGGKYRLEDSIGRGGMGEVFEATTLTTGQRVAVKVVNRAFADTMLIERLRREAEAARRVQSEFVPQLFDVDKTPEGELFLVMELLHGETLASRAAQARGVLRMGGASHLGEDVLRGLFDAHAAGVVHRDLKPGNIFIESMPGRRERARILDFGVCKLDVHDGESLTTTGEAVGTIAYMAPEQIRGASKVDERADLYAFAMVVFEALCGRLAYDAGGSIALIACKLEKAARSIRDLGRMPVPPRARRAARAVPRAPSGRASSVGGGAAARVARARGRRPSCPRPCRGGPSAATRRPRRASPRRRPG